MGHEEQGELTGTLLEEDSHLTLGDLSRTFGVHAECIVEMVEEGVITPEGKAPHSWRFTATNLRRVRIALRLQNDLGVNLPGVALALQLLEELESARGRSW